jgi:hypothetical protein
VLQLESGTATAENSYLQVNGKFTILGYGPTEDLDPRKAPVPALLKNQLPS